MPKPEQFRTVAEPPLPTIYSNATRFMASVYDFRLLFSEQMVTSEGEFVQVDRISVAMSPQHLKKLIRTMSVRIEEYEAKYGPIPQELETDFEANAEIKKDGNASKQENAPPETE